MSRHRNVRAINVSDEYEGYDDVYGHSVEDDYCISPSDAAQFMYDRARQPQMSAFFNEENNITEEDESELENVEQKSATGHLVLSDIDEAKMCSCLDEIRNIMGETIPENILREKILKNGFEMAKILDDIFNMPFTNVPDDPKPQRERRERNRDKANRSQEIEKGIDNSKSDVINPSVVNETELKPVSFNNVAVKIVPPSVRTIHITKGFNVLDKQDLDSSDSPKLSNSTTPRSQSPASDRETPVKTETEVDVKIKEANKAQGRTGDKKLDVIERYKKDRGSVKEQLHMVVIGHVDAGKSTLMGHLLYSLGQVNKKTMHKYEQESKKLGKQSFLFAWVLDETGEERSRGITMDVGQSKFETASKVVNLLDAPGHKDFIPNMITGATLADVALLVVDATRGEFETGFESGGQTREHALLVRSLGVYQLAVVVNKLDTVDWSQDRFKEVVNKLGTFLRQAGFKESDVTYVPCSGLTGENLVCKPTDSRLVQWYNGPCLIDVIDKFKTPERSISKPFRMSINDIFKGTGSGFCVSGRVEAGVVQAGDKVLLQPQNESTIIKALSIDEVPTQIAYAGDQVSATLSGIEMQNVAVGYVLCDPVKTVPVSTQFEARIVIFHIKIPITKGFSVILHHQSLTEQAVIVKLIAQLHKNTGEVIKRKPRCLLGNSSALVQIQTSRPIALELYSDVKELGRFMLRVAGITIAAGLVTKIL